MAPNVCSLALYRKPRLPTPLPDKGDVQPQSGVSPSETCALGLTRLKSLTMEPSPFHLSPITGSHTAEAERASVSTG